MLNDITNHQFNQETKTSDDANGGQSFSILRTFLDRVLPPEGDGERCWFTVKKGYPPRQGFCATNEELTRELQSINSRGLDSYFACCSFKDNSSRKAANAKSAKAFWLDIDAGEGKPYADRLVAQDALYKFVQTTGLPKPNLVICSGNGLHVYWVLSESIPAAEWVGIAERFKLLTEQHGLDADPARTDDAASVLRPPETSNWKNLENPKETYILSEGPDIELEAFVSVINNMLPGYVANLPNFDLGAMPKGPPDMTQGYGDGKRTQAMMHRVGWCLSLQRMTMEEAIKVCLAWNTHNTPPLEDEKVIKAVQSIAKSEAAKQAKSGAHSSSTSTNDQPNSESTDREKEDEATQKTKLIFIALQAGLWQDVDGNAYATVSMGQHYENYAIKSKGFRRWLTGVFGDRNMLRIGNHQVPSAPSAQSLSEAIAAIEARCMRGPIYKPAVRIGTADGKTYLDLGIPDWQVVEIDASGWRIVQSSPVKFIRPSGMRPLPIPTAGGAISELRPFLNVSDDDFTLVIAYMVMAFKSEGPYPILCINAEHGAGKTTATRIIRSLIDPNIADIRPAPKKEDDLIIAANNGWILAFDNVSHISGDLADAMCRISTGTGFGTRTFYTNIDETLIRVCRPQIVNGIPDLATRADFADRAVITAFSAIPDHLRKDEAAIWIEFNAAHPRILGALLDGVSCALRRPNIKLSKPPRMADFALWVEAAAPAFGWPEDHFIKIYQRNRHDITEATLDADEVASAIIKFVNSKKEWKGTMTDLYNALATPDSGRYWPKSPAALSNRIKRVTPAMRTIDIDIEIGERSAGQRIITIRKRA